MEVAVIGAGAAGLVTARELMRAGLSVTVFERAAHPTGTWVYGDSPLYASLRTNLPRDLMAFDDFAFEDAGDPRRFPGHEEVRRYLERFAQAHAIGPRMRTETTVTAVAPHTIQGLRWRVAWRDAQGPAEADFDAVAVCNGHYLEPEIPRLPGTETFGGRIVHSRQYREPSAFADRHVVLWGAKSSGIDLSRELSTVARRVVLCSRDSPRVDGLGPRGNLNLRPNITALEPGGMRLSDGSREAGIDTLILCTGYRYAFPFLDPSAGVLEPGPARVFPLHLDLLSTRSLRLAFVGLPYQVVPFPLMHRQARLWATALTGTAALPEAPVRHSMALERDARFAAAGVPPRHRLRYGPRQFRYNALLAELAGDPPPPAWRAQLNRIVAEHRRRDPEGYRDFVFPTASELG
ncbi:MAG: FAD-dependent oxidoreductase [Myxococcota bacterium]